MSLTDGKYEYVEYFPKNGAEEKARTDLSNKGELLGFCKRNGDNKHAYYHIKFTECGHECFIRSGKNLECNHKECVSKRMSEIRRDIFGRPEHKEKMKKISQEVQSRPEVREKLKKHFKEYWGKEENRKAQAEKKKKYFADADNRQAQSKRMSEYFSKKENRGKASEAMKKWYASMPNEKKQQMYQNRLITFSKPEYRAKTSQIKKAMFANYDYKIKYLERRAETERIRQNKDEMIFIQLLQNKGIEYVWQVPMITESGKGYVFDFYLPEFDLYINVDGGIHGIDRKPGNKIVDRKREDDKKLDKYCLEHDINLCHINANKLCSMNFDLEEVINQ